MNSSGKSQTVPIRAALSTNGSLASLATVPTNSGGLQTVTIRGGQAILTESKGSNSVQGIKSVVPNSVLQGRFFFSILSLIWTIVLNFDEYVI